LLDLAPLINNHFPPRRRLGQSAVCDKIDIIIVNENTASKAKSERRD
jgi:hypothetical protein